LGAGGIEVTGAIAPKYFSASAKTSSGEVSPTTVSTQLLGA
jgi:hypothetical protein